MKNTKQCPKCDGLAIGVFQLGVNAVNEDGSISLGGSFGVDAYACHDCGYTETFMSQPLSEWKKTPAEHGIKFSWLREPANTDGPYR